MLTYGCEAWRLTSSIKIALGAWNARRCAFIVGGDFVEACKGEPIFDLVGHVVERREAWAWKLLCHAEYGDNYLPALCAKAEVLKYGYRGKEGGIYQDIPEEWLELVQLERANLYDFSK